MCSKLLRLLSANTCVKITGSPKEQRSSKRLTSTANTIIPKMAKRNLCSEVIFLILSIIFTLCFSSVTSQPTSSLLSLMYLCILTIPKTIAKMEISSLMKVIFVKKVARLSQESMNSRYTNPLVAMNVIPKIHIFFLSFIPNNIVIKNIKIHIAHGLKPSTTPRTIANIGRDTVLELISPKIGTVKFSPEDIPVSLLIEFFRKNKPTRTITRSPKPKKTAFLFFIISFISQG